MECNICIISTIQCGRAHVSSWYGYGLVNRGYMHQQSCMPKYTHHSSTMWHSSTKTAATDAMTDTSVRITRLPISPSNISGLVNMYIADFAFVRVAGVKCTAGNSGTYLSSLLMLSSIRAMVGWIIKILCWEVRSLELNASGATWYTKLFPKPAIQNFLNLNNKAVYWNAIHSLTLAAPSTNAPIATDFSNFNQSYKYEYILVTIWLSAKIKVVFKCPDSDDSIYVMD